MKRVFANSKLLGQGTLLMSLFLMSLGVSAGEVTAKIKYIQVNVIAGTKDIVVVKFESEPINRPPCATDDRMIVKLDTEAGRAVLSMALAAKAADRAIYMRGTGDCTNALENIAYLRFI
ncbi:hypothetical protein SAMN02745866_03673 [Alteromonadaceae bacterium Bs31]|nr:hypothetical protein SAMN02745866_03673 [Alteromonadaceae bacterium Bs31]